MKFVNHSPKAALNKISSSIFNDIEIDIYQQAEHTQKSNTVCCTIFRYTGNKLAEEEEEEIEI